MLDEGQRFGTDSEQIAAKVMDGEAILINLSNGLYYRIGGAGGWIWAMIERRFSLAEMAEQLSGQFGLPADKALEDVRKIVSSLVDEELIATIDADGPAGESGLDTSELPSAYATPELEKYSDMAEMFALDPPLPGLADVSSDKPVPRSDD